MSKTLDLIATVGVYEIHKRRHACAYPYRLQDQRGVTQANKATEADARMWAEKNSKMTLAIRAIKEG